MHPFDDPERVRRTVEKIRIAERDVTGAGRDLRGDVGDDDVRLHDAELAVVDRHDRAMTAPVAAAAGRFRVAGERAGAVGALQRGVAVECRKAMAIGNEEVEAGNWNETLHHGGRGGRGGKTLRGPDLCVVRGGEAPYVFRQALFELS